MTFNHWWNRQGFNAATNIDAPSVIERDHILAQIAFAAGRAAGLAESSNYVTNDSTWPTEVTFASGRRVRTVETGEPGLPTRHSLIIDCPNPTLFTTDPQPPAVDIDISLR